MRNRRPPTLLGLIGALAAVAAADGGQASLADRADRPAAPSRNRLVVPFDEGARGHAGDPATAAIPALADPHLEAA